MKFKCDVVYLWTSGVIVFFIFLKLSSLVPFFSLSLFILNELQVQYIISLTLCLFTFWFSGTHICIQSTSHQCYDKYFLSLPYPTIYLIFYWCLSSLQHQ